MPHVAPNQVSCVIPYAGAQNYIQEAVNSAVSQDFAETIIVNDGCAAEQLRSVAGLRGVRIINLPQSVGCPNARNIGIKSCATPYLVFLDHDDLLCPGYFEAMSAWIHENKLRCAAATLRYIGEDSRRVGVVVSRHPDFFMPSGFFSEASLVSEAGMFPDCYSDDLLFFRSIRKLVRLTTCPGAGVLYRIHPKAESSQNTKAWWAFNQLLPLYDAGTRKLSDINSIAKDFARSGVVPPGLETTLSGSESALLRLFSRSAYACWLNRDFMGVTQYGFRLLRHVPGLYALARRKWSKH